MRVVFLAIAVLASPALGDVAVRGVKVDGHLSAADLNPGLPATWICFRPEAIRASCSSASTDAGIEYAEFEVEATLPSGEVHRFGNRHATASDACYEYRREWKRALKRATKACILAFEAGKDADGAIGWVWEKLKTDRGCAGWFADCPPRKARRKANSH